MVYEKLIYGLNLAKVYGTSDFRQVTFDVYYNFDIDTGNFLNREVLNFSVHVKALSLNHVYPNILEINKNGKTLLSLNNDYFYFDGSSILPFDSNFMYSLLISNI